MPPFDPRQLAPTLTADEQGIWRSPATGAISYPADGNDLCRQVEDGSFWFRHRNACIVAALERFRPTGVFGDVGGGNGFVAAAIAAAGHEVVLVEPGPEGARNARRRGVAHVVCGTTDDAGFADGSFGAVGLFDVVEHMADDDGFVRRMRALLPAGGRLFATVPAYAWLWSDEDDAAGHHHRYTRGGFARVLREAGFEVEYLTHFFAPLPLPILIARTLPYRLRSTRASHR